MLKRYYPIILIHATLAAFLSVLLLNRIDNGFAPFLDFGLFHLTFDKIYSGHEFSRIIFGHFQPMLILLSWVNHVLPWQWQVFFAGYIIFFINPLLIYVKYERLGLLIYFLIPVTWFVYLDIFVVEIILFPLVFFSIKFFEENRVTYFTVILLIGLLVKETFLFIAVGFFLISLLQSKWRFASIAFALGFIYILAYVFLSFAHDFDQHQLNVFSLEIWNFVRVKQWNWIEILKTALIFLVPLILFRRRRYYFLVSFAPFLVFAVLFNKDYLLFYSNQYLFMFLPLFIRDLVGADDEGQFNWKLLLLFSLFIATSFGASPISRFFYSDKVEKYSLVSYLPNFLGPTNDLDVAFGCLAAAGGRYSIQNNAFRPVSGLGHDFLLFPDGVVSPVVTPKFRGVDVSFETVKADGAILRPGGELFLGGDSCGYFYGKCRDIALLERYEEFRNLTKTSAVGAIKINDYEFYFFDESVMTRFLLCSQG